MLHICVCVCVTHIKKENKGIIIILVIIIVLISAAGLKVIAGIYNCLLLQTILYFWRHSSTSVDCGSLPGGFSCLENPD